MSDVVEAMARGMWCAASGRIGGVWDCGADDIIDDTIREYWREKARAAIRACHDAGGLVLREVPGHQRGDDDLSPYAQGLQVGWNNALAAVRAAAVEGV